MDRDQSKDSKDVDANVELPLQPRDARVRALLDKLERYARGDWQSDYASSHVPPSAKEQQDSFVQAYLRTLNTGDEETLLKLKGIAKKRVSYILQLREESPEPFQSIDDLQKIGLSAKQVKGLMKKEFGKIFD
ncbi:Kinesin-like protein [Trema orientale]|uniref:Kinesin-like protein n=1 Tax=Trema orientale TaxID=63057 RepID=A0A2P5FXB8_TREOI|nr:Kinesin-like protein [Trema orientale]